MQTRTRLRLAAAVIAAIALTGCGDDVAQTSDAVDEQSSSTSSTDLDSASASESASETSAPVTLPDCASVWVTGEKLPLKYDGCLEDGNRVKAKKYRCSYEAIIVTYDDRFYARAGRFINEVDSLKSSKKFKRAIAACQA
ncbi:hypothetical protein [Nocardioides sp.]|uniref:hypothetical protein n=1 Tax=Nocardioides sp. TaxID=35761 RepID=UPI00356171CC